MKLFKWIAADPEKLDKEQPYCIIFCGYFTSIFFYEEKGIWVFSSRTEIAATDWPHIQVLVDAEVSEGAFAEWAGKKGWQHDINDRWYRTDWTEDSNGVFEEEPEYATTAELYQEFLKQL